MECGTKWSFGYGLTSTMTSAPAKSAPDVASIDAVLLSHDQHGDNLDRTGRQFLESARQVITTNAGAKRLASSGGVRAIGLAPFATITVDGANGKKVRLTATPARHGPPLSEPFVGPVVGFVLESLDDENSVLYITGDTVFFSGVEAVGKRFRPRIVIAHLGAASYGLLRFTMNAREALKLARTFEDATIVPIHYDGWTHFKEKRADVERVFEAANLRERIVWLERGVATSL